MTGSMCPLLRSFIKRDFLPHVRGALCDKRTTLAYYRVQLVHLTAFHR